MSTATAKQNHDERNRGSGSQDTGRKHSLRAIDGMTGQVQALISGMSPEERRKMTAQWLSTWLKEGDGGPAMN